MKIGILGGSFDPPHLGHFLIAEQVKEILGIDKVWLMPLYQKSHQNKIFHKTLTPVAHRLNMAKLLENDFVTVSDFEILHNRTSYSLNTLKQLQESYPTDEFFWILGSDQLSVFQKYYKWKELVTSQKLIVFPREHTLWHIEERVKEALQLQTLPENVIVLQNNNLVLTNISSTLIRTRVANNLPVHYLVPEGVEKYIKKHKLYQ